MLQVELTVDMTEVNRYSIINMNPGITKMKAVLIKFISKCKFSLSSNVTVWLVTDLILYSKTRLGVVAWAPCQLPPSSWSKRLPLNHTDKLVDGGIFFVAVVDTSTLRHTAKKLLGFFFNVQMESKCCCYRGFSWFIGFGAVGECSVQPFWLKFSFSRCL